MEIAVIILLIIVILLVAKIAMTGQGKSPNLPLVKYGFKTKTQIMTNAEKTFYDKLLAALGDDHYIVPQAHLSMFLDHKIKGQNWKGAFALINGKSIDFLIVEKATQRPVLGIELDDYTHKRAERVRRDNLVNEILKNAGIPLRRYKNIDEISIISSLVEEYTP